MKNINDRADNFPVIRFTVMNWFLINLISPFLVSLGKAIQSPNPIYYHFLDFIWLHFVFICFTLFFSIPSAIIFGIIVGILKKYISSIILQKIILAITTYPLMLLAVKFFIVFMTRMLPFSEAKPISTDIYFQLIYYWLVACVTIFYISITKGYPPHKPWGVYQKKIYDED